MSKEVPGWIVIIVGAMTRFVIGAFGVSKPHPWRTGICKYFLPVAVPGCTIALPIVLFGWTIRLIFGKGRAYRMCCTLGDWMSSPAGKFLGKVLLWLLVIAAVGLLLTGLGLLIYEHGWLKVGLVALALVGGAALLIGLLIGISTSNDKLNKWKRNRPRKLRKEKEANPVLGWLWTSIKWTLGTVIWPLRMILIGVWQLLSFFGMILLAAKPGMGKVMGGIKALCPIVEFP